MLRLGESFFNEQVYEPGGEQNSSWDRDGMSNWFKCNKQVSNNNYGNNMCASILGTKAGCVANTKHIYRRTQL